MMPVAFVDVAQQCAPAIDVETLGAVVSVESRFQPFAIRIKSGTPLKKQPASRSEAIEIATALVAEGHDIDLGLTGLSATGLSGLDMSISDSFDVCLNLQAGASLMKKYYEAALRNGMAAPDAETVMLRSWYGHGEEEPGALVRYDETIAAERSRLSGRLVEIMISGTVSASPDAGNGPPAKEQRARTPLKGSAETGRPWDVFDAGRRTSVLVFSNEQQER